MKLQTIVPIEKQSKNAIDYNARVLLLGSCFSENIGTKFEYYKFNSTQNPFGILFHPKAIENLICNSLHQKKYTEKELFFKEERWHSFEVHSNLSNTNKDALLTLLNNAVLETKKQVEKASHIIITLGTAWVYKHTETNSIVANCHKVPQKEFTKELLSVAEITESLQTILTEINNVNKNCTVVFTVSPVRHLKDGFVENTRSKAHLITAIHKVLQNNKTVYFPSYEIMMDELRDYRFYQEDMLHPNKTAILYIWEKFVSVFFTENCQKTMKEVALIQKGMAHKPFHLESESHQKFLKKLDQKKEELKQKHPNLSFF